jgi:hypothetical protein
MVVMRKRVIESSRTPEPPESKWLNLEELASVEVTSENPAHPIECALASGSYTGTGWRAGRAGEQTIRLIFDQPQKIERIRLGIVEPDVERAQEFVLRWSADDKSFHEIVRQQWYFSPGGSTREVEDYSVRLDGVLVLELTIIPDRAGGSAIASIAELRLG